MSGNYHYVAEKDPQSQHSTLRYSSQAPNMGQWRLCEDQQEGYNPTLISQLLLALHRFCHIYVLLHRKKIVLHKLALTA